MARHKRIVAPINTIKHYVQDTNTTISSGAVLNTVIVDAVSQAAAGGLTSDVLEGSIIKAVYVESWLHSQQSAGASVQQNYIIEKVPTGAAGATAAQLLNLGAYDNKKNVLFSSQGNMGDLNQLSIPVFKGWILIPKGKQRFGLGDRLMTSFTPTGAGISMCQGFVYKEWK